MSNSDFDSKRRPLNADPQQNTQGGSSSIGSAGSTDLGRALLQRKLAGRLLQRKADKGVADDPAAVHEVAAKGVSGGGGPLPFLDTIQRSFGAEHDVSGVKGHVGGQATAAAEGIGAEAYAVGNDVAFGGAPSLHTAAHEAAHVVQQRSGVHLKGGVGEEGDAYEQHADAVADRVVAGQSAADLLGGASAGGATSSIQRKGKDVTDATQQEHRGAHDDADVKGGDSFASKVDLLAVRMKSAVATMNQARSAPETEAGVWGKIEVIQTQYDRIRDDSDDLARAALQMRSLSGAVKSVIHTDLAILSGAFAEFADACHRMMNFASKDGLKADPEMVRRNVENTFGAFDMKMADVTPVYKHDRVDDKSVEDLENQALKDSVGAIRATVNAVRMNVKSSAEAEVGGDLSKLFEAVHEVKEILSTIDVKHRIRKMDSLKAALADVHAMGDELQSASPSLRKRFDGNSVFQNDLRVLGGIVMEKHHK